MIRANHVRSFKPQVYSAPETQPRAMTSFLSASGIPILLTPYSQSKLPSSFPSFSSAEFVHDEDMSRKSTLGYWPEYRPSQNNFE
jgi:hypothetical protein